MEKQQISFEEIIKEMEEKSKGGEQKDLLDILLDPNNTAPIVLTDEKGERFTFDQIAIVPYEVDGEPILYVILKPITEIKGIADDEAVVFKVIENEDGEAMLCVEKDELISVEIFHRYYDMFEESRKKKRKITT